MSRKKSLKKAAAATVRGCKGSKRAANPVARCRAARHKPPGRPRPPGLGSKQNQLSLLDQNIAELSGDLQALKAPADKAHDAIEKMKAPLLVPGQIKSEVERVKTIAKGLDSPTRPIRRVRAGLA